MTLNPSTNYILLTFHLSRIINHFLFNFWRFLLMHHAFLLRDKTRTTEEPYLFNEKQQCPILQPCDYKKPSFRQVQCSIFNDQDILSDGKHNWTAYPIHDATIDPCELYCINENFVYTKLQASANDSTPCKGGTNNVCIGGKCRVSKWLPWNRA